MKTLILLGAVITMASLAGCATRNPETDNSNGTAAVTGVNTSNPGSLFNAQAPAKEDDDLLAF